MSNVIVDKIFENKIIAIVRGIGTDRILETVGALSKGGIKLIEVTFNQENESTITETLKCLELIKKEYGESICLGVGTVVTTDQVRNAVEAGAEYIISPNTDVDVIKKAKELGKISIPGAFTPTEMVTAYNAGADIVKLFPAGILGTDYIKALIAPLSHIPVVAVGGVNVDNINKFIEVGVKGVGVGGNLVNKAAIYAGDYNKIEQTAQAYIRNLRSI